jgi:hypothetical protein
MMKESKVYKGIEYIRLDELPVAQRDLLVNTINKELIIKIMIDGKIINDCLQYREYSFWYNSVYKVRPVSADNAQAQPIEFNRKLALNS